MGVMPHQPLDYERPAGTPPTSMRRTIGRVVLWAWALAACAFVFLLINISDYSSMQFPAALLLALSLLVAVVLTLVHWLWIVPMHWVQQRKARARQA
jgi:hypothetical protein